MAAHELVRRRALRYPVWGATLALFVAAACGGWCTVRALPEHGQPLHGLFVGGRVAPAHPPLGTWLEQRRQHLASSPIRLVHAMQVHEKTLAELGVEVDVARTMNAALAPGRTGSWRERFDTLRLAREGFLDVPLSYSQDERRAGAGLASIAQDVYRSPVNARLDIAAHAMIPEQPGEELDVDASLAAVLGAVERGEDVVALRTALVQAEVTLDDLTKVDVTRVVASFETRFHALGEGKARAINIERAAAAMDGLVLKPGQSFSFNEVVGRRTLERGYVWAPVIVGDELVPGVGGGVCQVASTLYAAVLHGALQIQERWAHGRPSSYTKLGLDATVTYPSKDLRFLNALPYPVMLHVFVAERGVLRAEVLGGPPIARVRYRYGVAKVEPFTRRVIEKPWFTPGRVVRHQKGIRGYSVVSLVVAEFADGRVEKRSYHSEYRPTPEILWVSPGTEASGLPALPEGAKASEERVSDASHQESPAG